MTDPQNTANALAEETPTVEIKEGHLQKLATNIAAELLKSDPTLINEIQGMMKAIESTKQEIIALRPVKMKEEEIPDATNVLDVIIKTNEEACATILACAEEINEVAEFVPAKLKEKLMDISTRIFESSNFDDLNGQRVRKVIKTLKTIEDRLQKIIAIFGQEETRTGEVLKELEGAQEKAPPATSKLEGPQNPDERASQEEIDRLLNGM